MYDNDNDGDIGSFNGDVMAMTNDRGLVCRGIWLLSFI